MFHKALFWLHKVPKNAVEVPRGLAILKYASFHSRGQDKGIQLRVDIVLFAHLLPI
jgi:hypothetical protein